MAWETLESTLALTRRKLDFDFPCLEFVISIPALIIFAPPKVPRKTWPEVNASSCTTVASKSRNPSHRGW